MEINVVLCGDSAEVLRGYPDAFFDSVVCDPPYGLSKEPDISEVLTKWLAGEPYDHGHGGFMGKAWDSFVPHPDLWREVLRVLKPGGHALVFAGTRTQDLMTIALRLGGFEIRDVIEWLYFNGFPKSMDVGKAIDKAAGAERKVVGFDSVAAKRSTAISTNAYGDYSGQSGDITAPATELARKWDGWGTALKPAHEPIIVARKPLAGTVAETVEKYGTGAINIAGCRIGRTDGDRTEYGVTGDEGSPTVNTFGQRERVAYTPDEAGRFPANCVTADNGAFYSPYFNVSPAELSKKASKRDRNSCVNGSHSPVPNTHPTVKPVALMSWLITLVTPPGGTVLDPFSGSGTTLVAAAQDGFNYVGIDMLPAHVDIANARLNTEGAGAIDAA
ncbi:DNA modification methylase [Paenibacillus sp. FSL R7-269]|uniref:DNA-methyltransferase n=1 Tax=Paenibacillus sp. FSL R7-269 TaxID=1226755 RepID=UPI0003E21CB7|nr:site-specific DNA-methyltransferase [Paenibacillus sp. FSL R7-269]ETT41599.1 DNA modification methylase [Paenibacillus sp. FSL R7-269]